MKRGNRSASPGATTASARCRLKPWSAAVRRPACSAARGDPHPRTEECRKRLGKSRGSHPLSPHTFGVPGSGTPLAAPLVRYLRRMNAQADAERGTNMSVAKVSEISATSSESFEDALKQGIARANKTLRNVRSAWVKEQQVRVREGSIIEYQINMMVTFVIDD